MDISHHGFVFPVSFSNKKKEDIRVRRKRNVRKRFDKKVFQVFVNNSQILPI